MDRFKVERLKKSAENLRVLYVEDDLFARESTDILLSAIFINVDIAVDGQEAYEMYLASKYDLIITDINMPKMDGFELSEKIRAKDIHIPILIISAHSEVDNFLTGIRLGVDGYLLKPIEMGQFFTLIIKVIKQIDTQNLLIEYQNNLEEVIKKKTNELKYRCSHEYYTDLPNSIMLHSDLDKINYDYMLLLDMSHFAVINKEYGKDFANQIIIKTAETLQCHITKNAKLYKTESDRFVILIKNVSSDEMIEFCKQIVSFFDIKCIAIDDIELPMTFNIGVSRLADAVHDTIIQCEYALDKSKEFGSRHFEIYDELNIDYKHEKDAIVWLKKTRELILNDKIKPYFQPIKNIAKNEVYKYEVLARGFLDGEIIEPKYFIPQAERLGLISSVTKSIINQSFEFFSHNDFMFSINITERDLLENFLIDFLSKKVKIHNIEPSRVSLEILENITILKHNCKITNQLNALSDLGFKISIDDFGVENSSFSRLLNLKLDYIKIDGLFIKGLKESEKNRTITKAIVNLAKTLNIKTIAEYVENEETYKLVKECGIDYAQGYHVGKPDSNLL
ncbi:MAG: EAL domain-containing protein [Sulfurimonas sp.]|nr:EAL domain-containing protein [Sulfurimonas sp.]